MLKYVKFLILVNYFVINVYLPFDDAVPSEAFVDAFAGTDEELLDKRRVFFETFEGVGKRFGIFFGNEDSRFSVDDDIRDAADVACDNWESEFHGFDENDSESFGIALAIDDGGECKDVCRSVFVREVFGRKLACEND